MKKLALLTVLVSSCFVLSSHQGALSYNYTFYVLDTLGGNFSTANDINNLNQVVGSSYTSYGTHAFLWENGTMHDLGTLGGIESWAAGINSRGQVVGHSETSAGNIRGFIWENGVMTELSTLPGGTESRASAINGLGQIVGRANTSTGEWHAVLWDNNNIIDLGTLGGVFSQANDINNLGQIVGTSKNSNGLDRAFLWENGTMTDLGAFGGNISWAMCINYSGIIGGRSRTDKRDAFGRITTPACIWQDGTMIELPLIQKNWAWALDINKWGQVVGYDGGMEAFMWWNGEMHHLENEVYSFGRDPWHANGINAAGTIVGFCMDRYGHERGYILWPVVPIPNPPITAEVDIEPNTLNLSSKGKWITCYIQLPENFDVADIFYCAILIGDVEIKADRLWIDEVKQYATAKLCREDVQDLLDPGEVELTVVGELLDETTFEGTATISVIDKGGK